MVTKEMAMNARSRQVFHHVTAKNADGSPLRARVNGKCKTWITRPREFSMPMKHGLYTCFYITQDNADQWSVAE
jgi:hypothetical protein